MYTVSPNQSFTWLSKHFNTKSLLSLYGSAYLDKKLSVLMQPKGALLSLSLDSTLIQFKPMDT
jgi:hypothetical protein